MFERIKASFGIGDEQSDSMPVKQDIEDGFITAKAYQSLTPDTRIIGDVVETETPHIGWKYFADDRMARIVIPAGATVVYPRHSHKLRTDKAYIDTAYDISGGLRFQQVDGESDADVVRGAYSEFEYEVGAYYTVDDLNTDTCSKCDVDGIYFFADKNRAVEMGVR
jgi:hypothetical protein